MSGNVQETNDVVDSLLRLTQAPADSPTDPHTIVDMKPMIVDPQELYVASMMPLQMEGEKRSKSRRWTRDEDEKLRLGVQALGPANWKKISEEYLGGRRKDVQCYQRWERTLKPGVKTGPWTKEEDQILKECIAAGMQKWSEIAKHIPGRLSKRVRERWTCQINPMRIKKDVVPWSQLEIDTIFEAKQRLGNRWVEIARLLPGRSENDVKNKAYCEMRKLERKELKHKLQQEAILADLKRDQESMAVLSTMYQAAMEEEEEEEERREQEEKAEGEPEEAVESN